MRLTSIALAFLLLGRMGAACDVPVFRYALERWPADLFEVDVFFQDQLAPDERAIVSKLEDQALVNGGSVNWEIVHCRANGALAPDLVAVREQLGDAKLPRVVLRRPGGRRGSPTVWTGPLSEATAALWTSPARQELVARLLRGDSVVWVVLAGTDQSQRAAARRLLAEQLPALAADTPLPPGVGRPGSEVLVPLPLEVKFSTVTADGSRESVLRQIVASCLAEPPSESETLVVPVFGRGRAMTAIRANELDELLVAEASRFLCGACSCQVKESNPGFDLLLAVNWEEGLFHGAAPPEPSQPGDESAQPAYVAIPVGNHRVEEEPTTSAIAASPFEVSSQRPNSPLTTTGSPTTNWWFSLQVLAIQSVSSDGVQIVGLAFVVLALAIGGWCWTQRWR